MQLSASVALSLLWAGRGRQTANTMSKYCVRRWCVLDENSRIRGSEAVGEGLRWKGVVRVSLG